MSGVYLKNMVFTLLKNIKRSIHKQIRKPFYNHVSSLKEAFELDNSSLVYPKIFGALNPDKKFYVIWRKNGGAGFFQILHL